MTRTWRTAMIVAAVAVALALAATGASADTDTGAGRLDITFRAKAWDVAVTDRHVVLLEADFRRVCAVDPATGKSAWRRRVVTNKDEPRGTHGLSLQAGRIALYAGPDIYTLDPRTGAARGPVTTVWNRRECRLEARHGAAGVECEHAMWLLDLDGMREIRYFPKNEMHIYHDLGGEHDTVWSQVRTGPIGRAGDVLVAAVEDQQFRGGMFDARLVTVGLDWKTGEERWRSADLLRRGWLDAGLTDGGRVGWFADDDARAIGAFETRTGKTLWRHAGPITSSGASSGAGSGTGGARSAPFVARLIPGRGLFSVIDGVASLRGVRDGKPRWTHKAPPGVQLWLAGQPTGGIAYVYPPRDRTVRFLDPATGALRHDVAIGAQDTVLVARESSRNHPDNSARDRARGFVVATPTRLREYGPDGALVRDAPRPADWVGQHLTASAVVGLRGGRTVIYDRATLAELGSVSGSRTVIGEVAGHLVLHHATAATSIGEVIAVRVR